MEARETINRKNMKRVAAVAAFVLIGALVANAAVFVYYPVGVDILPTAPDIILSPGSNANNTDLGGGTITVVIPGAVTNTNGNQTEAYITIHPTLQYTYYYDILRINNTNNALAYYVNIYINGSNVTAAFPAAYIVINGTKYPIPAAGNFISATNILLPAGDNLMVSLLFYAPDNQQFPNRVQLNITVVYSPVNEVFQPLP